MTIFSQAQKCMRHGSGCDEGRNVGQTINQKSCCEDTTILIDSDRYLSKIHGSKIINSNQIAVQPVSIIQANLSIIDLSHTHYSNYKPPLIDQDITILVQTFLI